MTTPDIYTCENNIIGNYLQINEERVSQFYHGHRNIIFDFSDEISEKLIPRFYGDEEAKNMLRKTHLSELLCKSNSFFRKKHNYEENPNISDALELINSMLADFKIKYNYPPVFYTGEKPDAIYNQDSYTMFFEPCGMPQDFSYYEIKCKIFFNKKDSLLSGKSEKIFDIECFISGDTNKALLEAMGKAQDFIKEKL